MDTGRKLNVHKLFRRRPGRLLNALCTFNLRPASTGHEIRKYQENLKTSLNYTLVLSFTPKMKILLILLKTDEIQNLNFSRSTLFHMKTRVRLKYFAHDCSIPRTAITNFCLHY